eukprot:m.218402 g.218402  ORF g.218402 m.218402 type:complete len:297 (+) comp25709_c0_seq9:243-1133(+)
MSRTYAVVAVVVTVVAMLPHRGTAKPTEECLASFGSQGQGGLRELSTEYVARLEGKKNLFNVVEHLRGFTGLGESELRERLMRVGRFHFEGEHNFWAPKSSTELRWFYSCSVDYLFANAIHPAHRGLARLRELAGTDGPVLDYSGGVGNNVLYLALQGVDVEYFGIGLIEAAFAEYRVRRMGLENKVTFIKPWNARTNWTLDAVNALPSTRYSAILAMDVLEHIPHYERTVKGLVASLKPGGVIVENTPFGAGGGGDRDTRVHVGNGGISMQQAMGPDMVSEKTDFGNVWRKKTSA